MYRYGPSVTKPPSVGLAATWKLRRPNVTLAQSIRLEGEFSGLAMTCFLYVAMQRMAPGTDIGFAVAAEYEQAKKIFDASR